MNDLLRTYLARAKQYVLIGEPAKAALEIQKAEALLGSKRALTPFDPTKPYRIVGYQFGFPLVVNDDTIGE